MKALSVLTLQDRGLRSSPIATLTVVYTKQVWLLDGISERWLVDESLTSCFLSVSFFFVKCGYAYERRPDRTSPNFFSLILAL